MVFLLLLFCQYIILLITSVVICILFHSLGSISYLFYLISVLLQYLDQDTPVGEIFKLSQVISGSNKRNIAGQIMEFYTSKIILHLTG